MKTKKVIMETTNCWLQELLSVNPLEVDKDSDKEILRLSIISELDAINLYEQFSNKVKDSELKKVLLDIAKEEKTHVGEFQALLEKIDLEHTRELKSGAKEVEKLKE